MKTKSVKVPTTKHMSTVVQTKSEHVRSANIERDTFTSDAFSRYVSDATIVDVIRRIAVSMQSGKSGRAFSITGPYGSGKSTLAVFLDGLLAAKKDPIYVQAKKLLDGISYDVSNILADGRHALHKETALIRCTITSQSEPVAASVIRALGIAEVLFYRYRLANICNRYISATLLFFAKYSIFLPNYLATIVLVPFHTYL